MTSVIVRQARMEDVVELVEVEKQTWSDLGTEVYGAGQFQSWLEVNPVCFLVAENKGKLVGYVYGQMMNFSVDDIPKFVSSDEVTDHGYTRKTHNPSGDSLYGMSVVSIQPGAGKVLIQAFYQLVIDLRKKCSFSFPRISGFDAYCRQLEETGVLPFPIPQDLEADVALWYAVECAKLAGEKVWDVCSVPPLFSLPKPIAPDPVLNWHLRHWHLPASRLGIVKVLHNFMPDRQSRNYTVFICSDLPGLK